VATDIEGSGERDQGRGGEGKREAEGVTEIDAVTKEKRVSSHTVIVT
jgi:hypothetical protein